MSKSNNTRQNHNNNVSNQVNNNVNHIEATTTTIQQETVTMETNNTTTVQETPRQEIEAVMELLTIMNEAIKNVRPALTNRKEFLKLLVASDMSAVEQELKLMEYTEMVSTIENAPPQRVGNPTTASTTTATTNDEEEFLDSQSAIMIGGRFVTQREAKAYFAGLNSAC